jgi:hypothetical protein
VHQPLAAFRWRRRNRLLDVEHIFPCLGVVAVETVRFGRAGLVVPERELGEVAAGSVLEDLEEILDRDGLPSWRSK